MSTPIESDPDPKPIPTSTPNVTLLAGGFVIVVALLVVFAVSVYLFGVRISNRLDTRSEAQTCIAKAQANWLTELINVSQLPLEQRPAALAHVNDLGVIYRKAPITCVR